jgi:hypothetical protein
MGVIFCVLEFFGRKLYFYEISIVEMLFLCIILSWEDEVLSRNYLTFTPWDNYVLKEPFVMNITIR